MVLFVAALMHKHWVWPTFFGFGLCVLIFLVLSIAEDVAGPAWPAMEGVFSYVWSQPGYWVYLLLVNAICLLPMLAWNYFQAQYLPTAGDILRELDRKSKESGDTESIRREAELEFAASIQRSSMSS